MQSQLKAPFLPKLFCYFLCKALLPTLLTLYNYGTTLMDHVQREIIPPFTARPVFDRVYRLVVFSISYLDFQLSTNIILLLIVLQLAVLQAVVLD